MIPLRAGPLSMVFDEKTAFLRRIMVRDQEVVRAIFAAVRDHNWDTIPFEIRDLNVEQHSESFSLRFIAECVHDTIGFQWAGHISGQLTGNLEYRFDGLATREFMRNRIGLCVLHPIFECADRDCTVAHQDGTVTHGKFPKWISPHQPFLQIKSIQHELGNRCKAKVSFAGDVFEMEDQRNWSDASYKTYSTPLERPFPVWLQKNDAVVQTVTVDIENAAVAPTQIRSECVQLRVDWQHAMDRVPVGVQLTTIPNLNEPSIRDNLRYIDPSHFRFDVRLLERNWQAGLSRALDLSAETNTPLEIAVFADSPSTIAWSQFLDMAKLHRASIVRCLVFHSSAKTTPEALIDASAESIESELGIPVVVGTDAYFAELNRQPVCPTPSKLVCFSVNPQVHAFDELSIRETIQSYDSLLDTAYHKFGCQSVLSPISLLPRFNPNATEQLNFDEQLRKAVDPRQNSGFTAAWTLGVLSSLLSHPRTHSITIFEACGPRGVQSETGSRYPVADTIAHFNRAQALFSTVSSHPLDVRSIAIQNSNGTRSVLVGNMSEQSRHVEFNGPAGTTQCFQAQPQSFLTIPLMSTKT